MAFLHKNSVCHGDFRPHDICYTVEGLDDVSEDDILVAYGRPQLLDIVHDNQYEWEEDWSASDNGDGESSMDQDSQTRDQRDLSESEDNHNSQDDVKEQQSDARQSQDIQQDDVSVSDDAPEADSEPDQDEVDQNEVDYEDTEHCPRYLVLNAYLDGASKYISDNIAVIDFGESFLSSQPLDSTVVPYEYRSPEGFFDGCGDLGFASDVWALGCTLLEVRHGECPFGDSDLWSIMPHWEDLSGPMPEPFRSSLADDFEVPDDRQQWVSVDEEEIDDWKGRYRLPNGSSSALLHSLSQELEYIVPLAEGEEPPDPRSQVHRIWCSPGNKILSVTISEDEASLIFDMAKNIFAWALGDRAQATDIFQHA